MKTTWQTKKLGEICYKASSNISQNQLKNEEGEYPIYGASGFIKNISFYHQNKEYISIIKDGAGIGRIALLPAKSSVIGTLQYLIPKENINLKFLYYILNSFDFSKYKNGSTIPHIYFREYSKEQFLVPPFPEQKRIVKVLDDVFGKLEIAKNNAEKNLQNSKELFESYLKSIFNNPDKDWEEKKLNEISENLDNKRIPITKNVRSSGEYPYYGASGIVDYVGEYIFNNDLLLVSEDGANLLARTYPIAFSISGKTWVNNHAHVLKFKQIESQKFVEYYLNSIKLDSYVSGMAQPKLNQKMLNSILIPYPSLSGQKAIVKRLDALSEQTKKLEVIYKQKLADLEELKKSVLKKAFSGEL